MKARKLKFDYFWVIMGICFLMVGTSLGFCSSGRTLYLTAITDALGIPRSAFSVNDTFRFVTTTIINIYFGRLVQRFGTKKLICAGFVFLMLFAIVNIMSTELYGFYIGSIFLGIGLSWTSTTMVSTIINRWCKTNKGTFTGAILAANGVFGAAAVQVLSPIIFEEGNPFGYRKSYWVVFFILLFALLAVLLFYRETPKGESSSPVEVAGKKKKVRGEGWVGMEYSQVVKKSYFYITLANIFLVGMVLHAISGIAVPHMYDVGISVETVAWISSISSILLTVAKFSTGFSYDRLGMRLSMNVCYICSFVSLLGLAFVADTPVGKTIAVIRGVVAPFGLPLETVMLPLFASELFGNRDFDKVVGMFVSVNYAGYALGSPFGNLFYDLCGSYEPAFIILSIIMLFVIVSMQFVLTSAKKDRETILKLQSNECDLA